MTLRNMFGEISLEATQQQVLTALGPLSTEATQAAVLAALGPLSTEATQAAVLAALGPLSTEATQAAVLAGVLGRLTDAQLRASPVGVRLWSWDHLADVDVRVHGNAHGGIYVNPQMPSKAIGRTKKEYNAVRTTSGLLISVTAGTELHLVDLLINGINASVSANTEFYLRDGSASGAIRFAYRHATAAVGTPEHFTAEMSYSEHPIFTIGPYLHIVTGTLTMGVNLHCYEAAH